jgi:catechol 2,3-dioxygenase-like lactoylglutathione lyase family enzyme
MNIKQIKETCIYYRDLELAKSFYHDKLGFPIIGYAQKRHIFFKVGSSVLLCFNPDDSRLKKSPPAHFSEGKYHFAFEVSPADYADHKKLMEEKGIKIIDRLQWNNGMESFYFEDPIGNILEIVPEGVWD